ncbi:hypothetical protein GCM10029963_75700 [Micromonospora andamanensis]|nr:hypothetical protein Vwe01_44900 [Micromonospora andamanensis]
MSAGDRAIGQVAKDFDLTETAVRDWVKQAEIDAGGRSGGLTSSTRRRPAPTVPRGCTPNSTPRAGG